MRDVIYARVSTEEQADKKFSIETQIEDCKRHCERQGDIVVKPYIDIQSGQDARKDREQFEQMLKDTRAGQFDKIVVWRPDRIFRGLTPAAKLASVLDENSIAIEGVSLPLDRKMIGLWAWVAEMEIQTMKERLGAGKRANARVLGKWNGGFIKYGYRYNSDVKSLTYTGKLEIDDAEASVIAGLFQWLDEGRTASDWCKWANEQGIATKRWSMGWTPQQVSEMLRDRCYTGKGAYGKSTRQGNKRVKADSPVAMQYPQIIEDALFNRVQQRLMENTQGSRGATKQGRTYILHHLGRCGVCGGSLCCTTNAMGHRYIYCLNQRRFPHLHHCHKPQNWQLGMIEDYIWDEVDDTLYHYRNNTYDLLLDRFENAKGEREQQIVNARTHIERCTQEKKRLVTAVRKGLLTDIEVEADLIAVRRDLEHWEAEAGNLEVLQDNDAAALDSFMAQLRRLDGMFDYTGFRPSPEQKKELLTTLLNQFVLYPDGKIELRFKLPINEKQVADTILTLSRNVIALPQKLC
ncbi:recombinase family protein, partial [Chloroflexota bacterium]